MDNQGKDESEPDQVTADQALTAAHDGLVEDLGSVLDVEAGLKAIVDRPQGQ